MGASGGCLVFTYLEGIKRVSGGNIESGQVRTSKDVPDISQTLF